MALPFLQKKESKKEILGATPEQAYQKGLASLHDILAPSALEINPKYLRLGEKIVQNFFIFNYPRFLNTNWFSSVINLDNTMDISFFIHPGDTGTALKHLRKNLAQVESEEKIAAGRGAAQRLGLEFEYRVTGYGGLAASLEHANQEATVSIITWQN